MRFPPEGLLYDTLENQEAIAGRRGLETACIEGRVLEARAVRCDGSCNLYVELCGHTVAIPRGEAVIDPERQKDVAILSASDGRSALRCCTFQTVTRRSPVLSSRAARRRRKPWTIL